MRKLIAFSLPLGEGDQPTQSLVDEGSNKKLYLLDQGKEDQPTRSLVDEGKSTAAEHRTRNAPAGKKPT